MTHLGAGGWHGPGGQNIFEDNDFSTAERFLNCAEATARMKEALSKSERPAY
jgi:hypothetical protein